MSRIWAVARHMIAESIRTKVALLFFVLIILILTVTPFVVVGDGLTLKSRVQSYLAYSLGLVGFLLSVLTVLMSCGALVGEVRGKQVFMIVSKPIPRWQFVAGKWLGISLLNAALLLVTFVAALGFTRYLSNRPTDVPYDRQKIQAELLTVHHGFSLEKPDFRNMVDGRVRRLKEEGRWEDAGDQADSVRRSQMAREFETEFRKLHPREVQQYQFTGLLDRLVDRKGDDLLFLRFKPTESTGDPEAFFHAAWDAGDPAEPDTLTGIREDSFVTERFHQFPLPARAVNSEGVLYLRFVNVSPDKTIVFEGDDSLQLLYAIGTFHWNLFRALVIIWCRLAFLGALGLLASSFLSFPVACMGCFLVLAVAAAAGWLAESIEWTYSRQVGDESFGLLANIIGPIVSGFVWLVPDFSTYDPIGNVVSGRVVTLQWVLISIAALVLTKGLILGIIGCVVFTKRELAQVVV